LTIKKIGKAIEAADELLVSRGQKQVATMKVFKCVYVCVCVCECVSATVCLIYRCNVWL